MSNPADVIDLTVDEPMIVDLTQEDPSQIAVPVTPPAVPQALVPIQGMPPNVPLWPLPMSTEGQPLYPTQPQLEGRPSLYQGERIEGQPSNLQLAIEGQPLDANGGPALRQSFEMVATSPTHSIAWRSAISTQAMSPIPLRSDEDTPEKALLRQTNERLTRQLQDAENVVYETAEQAERVVEATNHQARNTVRHSKSYGVNHEDARDATEHR